MHISNKSGSAVRNVKFENINVECDAWCARQILQKKENRDEQYVPDPNDNYVPNMICIDAYGKKSQIENIGFENVNVLGRRDAPSYIRSKEAECPVKNVSISNFKICGKDAKDAASANLKTKNAEGVVFQIGNIKTHKARHPPCRAFFTPAKRAQRVEKKTRKRRSVKSWQTTRNGKQLLPVYEKRLRIRRMRTAFPV